MTREQAIKWLKDMLKNFDLPQEQYQTALDMAIKVLEQEPCGDAISRQAVLENIKNLYPDMPVMDIMGSRRKWLDKYAPYFECENAVEQLPSVNPQEPKTGYWIKRPYGFKCSNCLIVHSHTSIFCPSCGAKMIGEPESEDKE